MKNRTDKESYIESIYTSNKIYRKDIEYKDGKKIKEWFYKNNILEGTYKEFDLNGKVLHSIEYKNGKKDGLEKHYNYDTNTIYVIKWKNNKKINNDTIDIDEDNLILSFVYIKNKIVDIFSNGEFVFFIIILILIFCFIFYMKYLGIFS